MSDVDKVVFPDWFHAERRVWVDNAILECLVIENIRDEELEGKLENDRQHPAKRWGLEVWTIKLHVVQLRDTLWVGNLELLRRNAADNTKLRK